jgi:hypothetical protein
MTTVVNDFERAAVAIYPDLQWLIDLRQSGRWTFQPVLLDGELMLVSGWRLWPLGWSEAIAIRDLGDANAYRCDPGGGEVWGREGSLVDVITGLIELPTPGQPGAPTLVKAQRPRLWTPGEIP